MVLNQRSFLRSDLVWAHWFTIRPHDSRKNLRPFAEKAPTKTHYIRVHFVFWWALGAFDFPWAPTKVQSAHFLYKHTLMVEHQKTKTPTKRKMFSFLAHLQNDGSFSKRRHCVLFQHTLTPTVLMSVLFRVPVLFCVDTEKPTQCMTVVKILAHLFSFWHWHCWCRFFSVSVL